MSAYVHHMNRIRINVRHHDGKEDIFITVLTHYNRLLKIDTAEGNQCFITTKIKCVCDRLI